MTKSRQLLEQLLEHCGQCVGDRYSGMGDDWVIEQITDDWVLLRSITTDNLKKVPRLALDRMTPLKSMRFS